MIYIIIYLSDACNVCLDRSSFSPTDLGGLFHEGGLEVGDEGVAQHHLRLFGTFHSSSSTFTVAEGVAAAAEAQ